MTAPDTKIPKELLSLAGEHRVASELCKRGVFTTITPGNRKQTDLYVFNDTKKRFLRIEVKASQTRRFVTGIGQRNRGDSSPDFWVLVLFRAGVERFFVLTDKEIRALQSARNRAWLRKYRARHQGQKFDVRRGVDNLRLADVAGQLYEDRWDKIVATVGGSGEIR